MTESAIVEDLKLYCGHGGRAAPDDRAAQADELDQQDFTAGGSDIIAGIRFGETAGDYWSADARLTVDDLTPLLDKAKILDDPFAAFVAHLDKAATAISMLALLLE